MRCESFPAIARSVPSNALYVATDALALPRELHEKAQRISINFPRGSLLNGLLEGTPALMQGLHALARPEALFELRLDDDALAEFGCSPAAGSAQVRRALHAAGLSVGAPIWMHARDLRAFPTTYAGRLAGARNPRAIYLRAVHLE